MNGIIIITDNCRTKLIAIYQSKSFKVQPYNSFLRSIAKTWYVGGDVMLDRPFAVTFEL